MIMKWKPGHAIGSYSTANIIPDSKVSSNLVAVPKREDHSSYKIPAVKLGMSHLLHNSIDNTVVKFIQTLDIYIILDR